MTALAIIAILLLSGCADDARAQKATQQQRQQLTAYQANMNAIVRSTALAWKASEQAHADTLWLHDLGTIKQHADANGRVDAEEVRTWVYKITAARDQNYLKIDTAVDTIEIDVSRAGLNLAQVLQIQALLDEYHGKGPDPEALSGLVDQITAKISSLGVKPAAKALIPAK